MDQRGRHGQRGGGIRPQADALPEGRQRQAQTQNGRPAVGLPQESRVAQLDALHPQHQHHRHQRRRRLPPVHVPGGEGRDEGNPDVLNQRHQQHGPGQRQPARQQGAQPGEIETHLVARRRIDREIAGTESRIQQAHDRQQQFDVVVEPVMVAKREGGQNSGQDCKDTQPRSGRGGIRGCRPEARRNINHRIRNGLHWKVFLAGRNRIVNEAPAARPRLIRLLPRPVCG